MMSEIFQKWVRLPKTIEAVQFTEDNKDRIFNSLTGQYAADFEDGKPILKVMTIHGDIAIVRLGDWIIKEPELGYYYPIKDSIFREGYVGAMSELKRFDLFEDNTTYPMNGSMEECVDGDYVLYDEVEKTIKQLRKEAHDKHCQLRAEVKRLESELAGMKIAYQLKVDVGGRPMSGCIKVQIGVGGSSIEEMNSNEDDEYRPVYISGEEIDFVGTVERVLAPCPNCDQLRAEYDAYRQTALVEADCLRKEVATRCAQLSRQADGYNLIKKEYGLE